MTGCYESSWSRMLLLLTAFVAGGVATQFVPPYQELAFIRAEAETVSDSSSPGTSSRGVTGIDVNTRHLNFVRSSS